MAGEKYTPNPGEAMETRAEVKANKIKEHTATKEALAADLQRKQEFAAAQAASDAEKMRQAEQSIIEAAFFGEDTPDRNLADHGTKINGENVTGEQEGFKRAERTVTNIGASSTNSYRVGTPGVDRRQGYQEGGSDVQPLPAEAKPSMWGKIKNFFKSDAQKEREQILAKPYEKVAVKPRSAAEEALSKQDMHGTVRSETRATMSGMENKASSTPLGSRKEIATLGEKMRATQALEEKGVKPEETKEEEFKKAA